MPALRVQIPQVRKLIKNMIPDDSQWKDAAQKTADKILRDEYKHQLEEAKREAQRQGQGFATIPLPSNAYFYIVGALCPKSSAKTEEICAKMEKAFPADSGQGVVPFFTPLNPGSRSEVLV